MTRKKNICNKDIIEFFDKYAPCWDEHMIRNEEVIKEILDNAGVRRGSRVLDVACGTGVLIPEYLERGAEEVTAVDISPKMIEIARGKFKEPNVQLIRADVMSDDMGTDYDSIVVYNAFPHFPNQKELIKRLSQLLKVGGRLTVAHGMSREWIEKHHEGAACKVSVGLMQADALADIFSDYLDVLNVISDSRMYQVVGEKRA